MESLRVFISSTMRDLQEERTAIDRAISCPPFEARRAETTGAQSASSRETVVGAVAASDIYLGILGGRYGYIPPNESISVTEMEFNEARKLGKPILLYRKQVQAPDPRQEDFIKRIGHFDEGYSWREFCDRDVADQLGEWVRQDLKRLLGKLVDSASTGTGDAVLAGRCLLALAHISADAGELHRAASLLERLVAEQLGEPLVRDCGMERLATLYAELEAWDDAVDVGHSRTKEYRAMPLDEPGHYAHREKRDGERERRIALARLYLKKADCHDRAGEWNEAVDAFSQAAAQYRKASEEGPRKDALASVGSVCEKAGDSCLDREQPDTAISHYRHALGMYQQLGKHDDWGRLLHSLGVVYLSQGRIAEAIDQFEGAIPHHQKAGRYDSSVTTADRLMEVYWENPHIAGAPALLLLAGDTYVKADHDAKALEALEESRRISRDQGDHATYAQASLLMAELSAKEAKLCSRQWEDYQRKQLRVRAVQLYGDAVRLLNEAAGAFEQLGNQPKWRRTTKRSEDFVSAIIDLGAQLRPPVEATAASVTTSRRD